MSRKDIRTLIMIAIFFACFLTSLLGSVPSDDDCPAPKNLESMEVYKALSNSVTQESSTEEVMEAFAQMCDMSVECRSDMVLLEYFKSSDSDVFIVHVARQFKFSDSQEFVQLHLDLEYPVSELNDTPRNSAWYTTSVTDIYQVLTQSAGYACVKDVAPIDVKVSIGWTW